MHSIAFFQTKAAPAWNPFLMMTDLSTVLERVAGSVDLSRRGEYHAPLDNVRLLNPKQAAIDSALEDDAGAEMIPGFGT